MTTHYLTVTDLELLASQVVKIIAIVILVSAAVINIIKTLKPHSTSYKIGRLVISACLILVSLLILEWVYIEGSLMNSDQYVVGTTVGICQVIVRGQGVEFEYQVNNTTYRNCNTSHPISIDEINVAGGEYLVRYARKYPDKGRMDFEKPLK